MMLYEKPTAEVINFNISENIMDEQGGAGEIPGISGDGVGDSPFG